MNRTRLIALGLVGGIVLIGALGWLAGVSPLMSQIAAADGERASIAATNDANQIKVKALSEQFKKVDALQASLNTLRQSIPKDASIPLLLREINGYCAQFGVTLSSVAVAGTTEFASAVTPAGTAAAAAGTPAPTASPTPAPGAAAAAPAAPAGSGLYVVPVTVIVSGPYANVIAFTGAMQKGPRLFLVTLFSIGPNGAEFTATLNGKTFALPLAAGEVSVTPTPVPVPVPVVPAPAATQSTQSSQAAAEQPAAPAAPVPVAPVVPDPVPSDPAPSPAP